MKTNRSVILPILLVFSLSALGQSVYIKGSGSGYNNTELRFFSQTDPVTKRLKPILSVTCDEKGSFSCEVPCSNSEVLFIDAGTFRFRLYATEGSRYELSFPNYVPKSGIEDQNPFFKETELMPEVINNTQDVNNLIRDFDSDYDPIFNFVADRVFRNYKNEDIQKEISKLDKYPLVRDIPFYTDYIRCRMLMLNLVNSSTGPDQVKALEFINTNFNTRNQAFTDLVEQMFSGYFNNFVSGPLKDSFARAIATGSFSELRKVFQRDDKIKNIELLDFVALLNLYASYYNRSLPADNIRKIITIMKVQGESEFVKNIANVIMDKINSSLPGNSLPDFSLLNSDMKLMSLKDFRGKYLLLCFARSDNPPSMMELGTINMWQKKYANDIQIVTILADNNFSSGLAKMKRSGYNWVFLDGSKRDNLEFRYDIKMYPSFVLLDREGKIIEDPCSYPSENLELRINKMLIANPVHSAPEN